MHFILQTASSLTGLISVLFSLLYLVVILNVEYTPEGPVSTVPIEAQYAMALISPVAVALGIGQVRILSSLSYLKSMTNINI